ncbi:HNH endonuclease signature motif containing protein [Microbacterium sp. 2FI]|uniref:HNH endonuclease signature motif containing protein n=1 Tax=Microbacterium sp. 2FI TaxID=2502193 RepID=UPI00201659F8|nr:HNH endonuclease signature motif containing protein [Microbacterium sp. 2FI]
MHFDDDPPDDDDPGRDYRSADDAWVPDAVDLVLEVATMLSVFAAQQLRRIDAMRREALAEAVGRGSGVREIIDRGIRLELAAALRITEYAAAELIVRADALVHRFPQMLDSLSGGRTTERHTQIFVAAMAGLEVEFHERVVPQAIVLAEIEPVGTFRRSLRALLETVRAETLSERHAVAVAGRRTVVEPAENGMAWYMALIPEVEARAIDARATAMAKAIAGREGETRTLDQIRADVVCDLLIEGWTDAVPDEAQGIRATVAVTVPALALLDRGDLCDGAAGAGAGSGVSEPATVEGIGPIPIERARELCGGADGWMRILTHPETGVVLSVGRDQYRPPPGLRKLVKWRAGRCMAPGCGMPTDRCEIDHSIDWMLGGETSIVNLAPLCKGHHTVKHHGGWGVRQVDGGALEWTSPSGRRYRVDPERRVPVFRTSSEPAPF